MQEKAEELFQFELISPEKKFLGSDVKMVTAPGIAGEFGVLKDHSALLSSLKPGVVTAFNTTERGVEPSHEIFISGGFCEVQGDSFVVLAEDAVYVSDLNIGDMERAVKALKDDLSHIESETEKRRVEKSLGVAQVKLDAVKRAA
jgi:F-type H+-transporting ATPase subunit epsilon